MINKYIIAIVLIMSFSPLSANDLSLEEKIQQLNQQTIKSLGISLNALTYLVEADSTSYMPLWHVKELGKFQFIKELENAGYVKIIIQRGLPDGSQPIEEFLNIVPLKTGIEARECFFALKHNKRVN